jgi:16S rRNA (uracil1498-N3)-methyltransferase
MSKRSRRLFAAFQPAAAADDEVVLSDQEIHHARVLRLNPGDALELFNGEGFCVSARLIVNAKNDYAAKLLEKPHPDERRLESEGRNAASRMVKLAVAWPKGKRAAWLIEKCVELGVGELYPLICARSVVCKGASGRTEGLERLRRIIVAAAKQCGRNDTPKLEAEKSFADILSAPPSAFGKFILQPRAANGLLELISAADDRTQTRRPADVLLLIGPEGGFTVAELAAAQRAGFQPAAVSPHVLRVETAAVAACALAVAARP